MPDVPVELDGARVLKYARLTAAVEPTGATRHIVGAVEAGPFAGVAIARYDDEDGYYLFYLGANGEVLTDTWHESIEGALEQSGVEYEGLTRVEVAADRSA
jgi:hypothetical protein